MSKVNPSLELVVPAVYSAECMQTDRVLQVLEEVQIKILTMVIEMVIIIVYIQVIQKMVK